MSVLATYMRNQVFKQYLYIKILEKAIIKF